VDDPHPARRHIRDDPAFAGKKRETTAADFVLRLETHRRPARTARHSDLLEHKIVGLRRRGGQAKSSGRFDYDAEVQGLRAADRYTIRLELIEPDYTFSRSSTVRRYAPWPAR